MKMKLLVSSLVITMTLGSFSHEGNIKSAGIFTTINVSSPINFYQGNYDNFLREAKKQKKPIMLDFWAIWCNPCKKMEAETFSNAQLSNYINENFLCFKVNIDTLDGMDIADRFAVDNFPTLILLDAKAKYITRFRGIFPPNYLLTELPKNKDLKGKPFVIPKEKVIIE